MILNSIGEMIAFREYDLKDGKKISIEIGKPQPFPDGIDYYCPYSITGIAAKGISYGAGVDPIQALLIALDAISTLIQQEQRRHKNDLSWKFGKDGYLGLPKITFDK